MDLADKEARRILRDARWQPVAGLGLARDHELAATDIATALRAAERRGRIGGLETAEMIARSHVHHFNGLQIAASIQSEIDALAPKVKP